MNKLEITNPSKILYPKDKITKLDVISYYYEISSLMLPFVKNRLLSVIRCHENIYEECFFKKHPLNDENIEKFKIDNNEYFYIINPKQLITQAQFGTLEFHTWASNIKNINNPDIMTFDLDPDEKLSLNKVRDAVLKVKSVLDELKLESFLKTSGGKGYHILIPFTKTTSWEKFYDLSKQISLLIESKWNKEFTTNIKKNQRNGKIFIDYLRNNKGSTCVAPYSLRAREKAPISMPIYWHDLFNIKPNEVNLKNYKKYLNNSLESFFKIKQKLI